MPAPLIAAGISVAAALAPKVISFFKKHPFVVPFGLGIPAIAAFLVWVFVAGALSGLQYIRIPITANPFCMPSIVSALSLGALDGCTPTYSDGTWVYPTVPSPITDFYGNRANPFGPGIVFHSGVDMDGNLSDDVFAASSGTVIETANENSTYGLGNYIVIDHGNGLTSWYGHLMPGGVLVTVGQVVKAGEHIGEQGTTGSSTGVHLHYTMRLNGKLIDPLLFMIQQGVDLSSAGVNFNFADAGTASGYCIMPVYPWSWC